MDSYSNKSLAQTIAMIKQKLRPYGWTAQAKIVWVLDRQIFGHFNIGSDSFTVFYQLPHELTKDQSKDLFRVIVDVF